VQQAPWRKSPEWLAVHASDPCARQKVFQQDADFTKVVQDSKLTTLKTSQTAMIHNCHMAHAKPCPIDKVASPEDMCRNTVTLQTYVRLRLLVLFASLMTGYTALRDFDQMMAAPLHP
jgi:hypothetical protein